MALLNPTLQPQFKTYSRHKPAFLWLQLMRQMNGHVLTLPVNSGANLSLSSMLLMTLTLSLPQTPEPLHDNTTHSFQTQCLFSFFHMQIVFFAWKEFRSCTCIPNPGNPDIPSDSDEMQLETTETTENSPIVNIPALFIDTSQQITAQKSTNPLQRFSRAVGQILTPKHPFRTHKNKTSHQLPKMSQTLQLPYQTLR